MAAVQAGVHPHRRQPGRNLQAHFIAQGSLRQLIQGLPLAEPFELPFKAAEAQLRLQQIQRKPEPLRRLIAAALPAPCAAQQLRTDLKLFPLDGRLQAQLRQRLG